MRTVVVYESMFGNTHQVAEAVAEGLRESGDVDLLRIYEATETTFDTADLLVVGGPTHVHGMSSQLTRTEAARMASAPDSDLSLEPNTAGKGVREWLDTAGELPALYAAFDTRADAAKWLTGSAANQIAKKLKHRDRSEVCEPGSFLAPDNDIDTSELDRARDWGRAAGIAAAARVG